MSNRSWMLVALVIGGGILLQIPSWGGHAEHHARDGHAHDSEMRSAERPGETTVHLEVTGMT